MKDRRWLQLFADGGDGAGSSSAEGANTGDGSADAGQSYESKLEALGVPKEKIRNRSNKEGETSSTQTKPKSEPQAETAQEDARRQDDAAKETDTVPKRMTWDEIMADPEYNQQMQETVKNRLRQSKQAEDTLEKLKPALDLLSSRYKVDPSNVESLAAAIVDDSAYYEDKALEMGVDTETAKRIDQIERENERMKREREMTIEQQKVQAHIAKLGLQAEALKAQFPSFDLRTEMQNPVFVRLTAPDSALSLEDAYFAVHRKEIQAASMQVAAQKALEKASSSVQSGQKRPIENGASLQAASVTTFDYSKASKEQREELKNKIRLAAARGEKIYPPYKRKE